MICAGQLNREITANNIELTLVLDLTNWSQKWLKIFATKQSFFLVFATDCWWIVVNISTSILECIVWELAGGGSMAVAVGISEMWQGMWDTWHLTTATCHLTPDYWHLSYYLWYYRTRWEIQCLLYTGFFTLQMLRQDILHCERVLFGSPTFLFVFTLQTYWGCSNACNWSENSENWRKKCIFLSNARHRDQVKSKVYILFVFCQDFIF